ncbi:MAG: glycosyl transferase, partial [Alphaproteobacteria bacterium]
KSFPAHGGGFEIETELTAHAHELAQPTAEVETAYRARPPGSASKLNTIGDGMRIAATILRLVKDERPLPFFSILFALLAAGAVALALPLLETYAATGTVPRLPTAVLATGIMLLAFLMLAVGLILDTVTRGRRETKRLAYLRLAGPAPPAA